MIKKFLKRLCTLLLIGLPILFVNFSSAWLQEFDLWQIESITANSSLGYDLRLTANANFLTNDLYKVVQFKGNWTYPSIWTYFRNGSWMYVINSCIWGYDCNWSIIWQWYFNYVNIVELSTINMEYSVSPWFTPIEDFLTNSDYKNPDKLLLGGYWQLQSASLCFWYTSIDKAVCFSFDRVDWNNCSWQPQFCTNWQLSYITNSKWYTTQDITQLAQVATVSPFVNIPEDKPTYDIWEKEYNYWQIVEWYEYCWLDVWYCYWGFPIDNIFLPNETIEDFTGYKFWYGANIWYLYSLYSDTYTPKQFFQQMYQAYTNWQINRFKNEPKALIMFVQQYVSGKNRWVLNVWFYDLWDYCNIKLWYNNLSDPYTWHNSTPKTCYQSKKTDTQNQWWFNFTWNNALNHVVWSWGTGFSNPAEFFWNITSMFQNWIWIVDTNYTWFIPTYILMFMFALILIRILKH